MTGKKKHVNETNPTLKRHLFKSIFFQKNENVNTAYKL